MPGRSGTPGAAPAGPAAPEVTMRSQLTITVVATDYGRHPAVLGLNPTFEPDARTIKLTLTIDWRPHDAAAALNHVEGELLAASPSFRMHQCRGPHQYRVFLEAQRRPAAVPEAALALAHLIEHVMIDAIAFVTGAPRISGVTGARADADDTFDVFVECPSRAVAHLAGRVGTAWIESLVTGRPVNGQPLDTLHVARLLYAYRPAAVDAGLTARTLGHDRDRAQRTLAGLRASGFAEELPATLNFSGYPLYRFADTTSR